jgi:hypothetical protein
MFPLLASPLLLVALSLVPAGVTEILGDTTLDPSRTYGPLVIKASNITIDGRGATILGVKEGDPKAFRGVGILAKGVTNVTLKDVKVKGFEMGLHIVESKGLTVEGCDFSDNFHDPAFGWGENGRRGGILLERVEDSRQRGSRRVGPV